MRLQTSGRALERIGSRQQLPQLEPSALVHRAVEVAPCADPKGRVAIGQVAHAPVGKPRHLRGFVEQQHDITMGAGEVAEFDTKLPHWFGPADDQPVEVLSLHNRDGHHPHVRAKPREGGSHSHGS